MKKKSTNNFPSQPSLHNNIPPQCGDGNYLSGSINKELGELILFNSIQDTYKPEDEDTYTINSKYNDN